MAKYTSEQIDIADHVHHGPTGENWIVAAVALDRLYWCGWPFGGSALLSDCTLTRKATKEERLTLLGELSIIQGDEYPIIHAREVLERRNHA